MQCVRISWAQFFLALSLGLTGSLAAGADSSSGCGPGWYVLKDNSLVSSLVRNITHAFLSPVVTTGMTFGTSNCAQHKIVEQNQRSQHFVAHNLHQLRLQTALGEGEHLSALANTFGCQWQAQERFNLMMHRSYSEIYGQGERHAQLIHQDMVNVIYSDPELSRQCAHS